MRYKVIPDTRTFAIVKVKEFSIFRQLESADVLRNLKESTGDVHKHRPSFTHSSISV
jgi:hypothetical protein